MYNHKELLLTFKEYIGVLNLSPSTIRHYVMHVRLFLEVVSIPDIKQITTTIIEQYIVGLYNYRNQVGRPYAVGTISNKICSIKRFFEFLEQSNVIFIDPCEFIRVPKVDKSRIKITLTNSEVKNILNQPNLGTLAGIRDRTILEVFYSTGIRLNELCSLNIYDADLKGGTLRINKGKGGKDRVVPMGKHAVKFLREYIAKVRPQFTQKNQTNHTLFVNKYGGPLRDQVVGIIIREHVKATNIKKHVSAHTFRHSFATVLVKNGADITAVQKMMGHQGISTTQIYIRSLGIDIKKEHKETHPREKDTEKATTATPDIKRLKGNYERKQH